MKNNISELVFILDRSGSMSGLEGDTIGGFNSLIEKQKKEEGRCYVTTVLFDNVSETLHDRVDLKDIRPISEKEYSVRGCTALLDALGDTIRRISDIHRYIRPEDVPQHTTFVIMTDGMENASHSYDSRTVKRMIERKKEENSWEFLFLAANIDAVETAAKIGIAEDRAVDYRADSLGTRIAYEAVAETVSSARAGRAISPMWKKKISEDYAKRGS